MTEMGDRIARQRALALGASDTLPQTAEDGQFTPDDRPVFGEA